MLVFTGIDLHNGLYMPSDICFWSICFFKLPENSPTLFGFPEILSGMALLLIAWTNADIRYRFRISLAPFDLRRVTFITISLIALLTLLTDLWRANEWYVPRGDLISSATWQFLLAITLLLNFIIWVFTAFISPPRFTDRNATIFGKALFDYIFRSSPDELAIIADELNRSSEQIIKAAPNIPRHHHAPSRALKTSEALANDILGLIADRRFCRAMLKNAPQTVVSIFDMAIEHNKFDANLETLGRNLFNEALLDPQSFIYNESDSYSSGLLGDIQPLRQTLYSNYQLVESVGGLLDIDFDAKLDNNAWRGYMGLVLTATQAYISEGAKNHSYTLSRAFHKLKDHLQFYNWRSHPSDEHQWSNGPDRFIFDFINLAENVAEIVNERPNLLARAQKGRRKRSPHDYTKDLTLPFADIFFAMIQFASRKQGETWWDYWSLQYGSVWGPLTHYEEAHGEFAHIVMNRVRRMILRGILELDRFPNYSGAAYLGFVLNVMGLNRSNSGRLGNRALHRAVLNWTRKNFATISASHPKLASATLVKDWEYDEAKHQIIQTREETGLKKGVRQQVLQLDPPRTLD